MQERTTKIENSACLTGLTKRKDSRLPISPMIVSIHKGQTKFFGVGLNLSRSGMFFQTPELIGIGEIIKVKFTLPKTDTAVTCDSKVVWCKCFNSVRRGSTHAGIQFVDIEPGAAEYLGMLAQQHDEPQTN